MKGHIYNSYACLQDPRALAMDWNDKDRMDLEGALVWHKKHELKALGRDLSRPRREETATDKTAMIAGHVNDGYGDGYQEGYARGFDRGFGAGVQKMEMEPLESSTRPEAGRGDAQLCPVCSKSFKSLKRHLCNRYQCLRQPRAFGLNWSEQDMKELLGALARYKGSAELKAREQNAGHMSDGYGDGSRAGYDCGYERGFQAGAQKAEMEPSESSTRPEGVRSSGRSKGSARYQPYDAYESVSPHCRP